MPDIMLTEVSIRDGFQALPKIIPSDLKIKLATMLIDAGFKRLEIGSFVSEKNRFFDKFADSKFILETINNYIKSNYSNEILLTALVPPSYHYYKLAKKAGYTSIATFVSANQNHHSLNTNGKLIEDSINRISSMRTDALKNNFDFRVYVVTAFGYKKPSDVPLKYLQEITNSIAGNYYIQNKKRGVYEISFGDTTTTWTEKRSNEISTILKDYNGIAPNIAYHFHQNNIKSLKKELDVALKSGITSFDVSLQLDDLILGGCMVGNQGNASSVEVVKYLNKRNLHTGINLDKLEEAKRFFSKKYKLIKEIKS